MNRLTKRLETLEARKGGGFAILIVDAFDGDDPVIREALLDGELHERGADEQQEAFLRRINLRSRPSAMLEADCGEL